MAINAQNKIDVAVNIKDEDLRRIERIADPWDNFAAAALVGYTTRGWERPEQTAKRVGEYADAMMQERFKRVSVLKDHPITASDRTEPETRIEKMNRVLKEEQERDAECRKAEERAKLYEDMCKYFLDKYENNAPYRYEDNEPYVNTRKNWYREIKNRIRALEDV